MRIRFFGDSWYWSWFYRGGYVEIKSNYVKNTLRKEQGFPVFEAYLKFFDIDCEFHNEEGTTFIENVNKILNTTDQSNIKYNVLFFSSLLRMDGNNSLPVDSFQKFTEAWDTTVIYGLQKLQEWAEKNDQHILIIGGQSTLYKYVFEKVDNRKNLHLLSECILSSLEKKGEPYGIFKFADDIVSLIDDTYHKELVHMIYGHLSEKDRRTPNHFTWPDIAHLNPLGALLVTDLILSKIEEIENTGE
jgi:hypothetical protein